MPYVFVTSEHMQWGDMQGFSEDGGGQRLQSSNRSMQDERPTGGDGMCAKT